MGAGVYGWKRWIFYCFLGILTVLGLGFRDASAHQCSHGHNHDHHHHHHLHSDESKMTNQNLRREVLLLPEEIAELEDLKMMWAEDDHAHEIHRHSHDEYLELSGFGLWIHALACSLLVSLASLICLIFLPLIFSKGKPSKAVVDALALFGAGAMLGDAFLHQLPHAFGGGNSHSHDRGDHDHVHSGHSHSHSIKELSIGLSILAGIVLFLIVEKLVRFVEDSSAGRPGHHHHQHPKKLKDIDSHENHEEEKRGSLSKEESDGKKSDGPAENGTLCKRKSLSVSTEVKRSVSEKKQSNLVFGYLNLFSDGVHNFTDGMALGSAFLLYGSVGGWSRTLFLLAHELPQEIGDFGILVRSGFSTSKALFFNFLSALVALAGTAVALIWGNDPSQSSIIEGLTAGGFIYISLGVLAETNTAASTLRSAAVGLMAFILGMAVALCISLVE